SRRSRACRDRARPTSRACAPATAAGRRSATRRLHHARPHCRRRDCVRVKPARPWPSAYRKAQAFRSLPDKRSVSSISVLRSRLTYANVMSSIALFVALSGGAYALSVPRNSVGSRELRPGAVTAAKVKHHSLTASLFRHGALPLLGGVRAADLNPAPRPTTVVKSVKLRLRAKGKAFVLATVRDVFLTCGSSPCSGQWGVYVDNHPVRSTGMRLQAIGEASDGYTFYTLYGLTKRL